MDTFRYLHPEQEGAYTNWCTLTGARATNYGRRLDYIFGNVDLVQSCLTGASIMPDIEGSDHCPIKAEISCEPVPSKTCPPLCTKFMPEFVGKQQKLSMFFTKLKKEETSEKTAPADDLYVNMVKKASEEEGISNIKPSVSQIGIKRSAESSKNAVSLKKRKTDNKKPDIGTKQSSLKSFFTMNSKEEKKIGPVTVESNPPPKPEDTVNKTSSVYFNKGSIQTEHERVKEDQCPDNASDNSNDVKLVENKVNAVSDNKTVNAWKNLLGGLGPPPLCNGHKEPCVLRMVKKQGPNRGRQFYTCARGEGLKTNPEARCDFFKWVEKKKS